MYINGHFCYAYKFGIITNGLDIVRDITFYNKDFLNAHPDIVVEKKSDSPDEDLIDFFQKHPLINPKVFLGDAAFDTIEIYKSHLRSNLPTMKFVCPKMKWEYNKADKSKRRVCHCDNPYTTSSCGRMIYVYPEKNLRAYPGVERSSTEWDETYKIRVSVEKFISINTSEL